MMSLKNRIDHKYNADGIMHGMQRGYNENGSLGYVCTYVNGVAQGYGATWDLRGKMSGAEYYINNRMDGERLEYLK